MNRPGRRWRAPLDRPWRDVENVSMSTGPHGGRAWILTLNCGHVAVRSMPSSRRVVFGSGGPLRKADGSRKNRVQLLAPRRVKCMLCKEIEP